MIPMTFILLTSCEDNNNSTPSNNGGGGIGSGGGTTNYFMTVNYNGSSYNSSNLNGVYAFTNRTGCTNLKYTLTNIGEIHTSQIDYYCFLHHYSNNIDFTNLQTGTYSVNQWTTPLNLTGCALDLYSSLEYDTATVTWGDNFNLSGGTNNVTSIVQDSVTSTSIIYAVSGNFTLNFIKPNGQVVPVTGSYKVPIVAKL